MRPARKRSLVDGMRADWQVSIRRACEVIRFDPRTYRYKSRRPGQAALEQRIREICQTRVRFGYRRVHVMLERQGVRMNVKKPRRLYAEEKLQVKRRDGRKRALGTRRPLEVPDRPNRRWSLDFVSDAFTGGRRFRVLAVDDDFTRECLARVAKRAQESHRSANQMKTASQSGRPFSVSPSEFRPTRTASYSRTVRTPSA